MRKSTFVMLFAAIAPAILTPFVLAFPFEQQSILRRCFDSLCGACAFGGCNGIVGNQPDASPDTIPYNSQSSSVVLNNNKIHIGQPDETDQREDLGNDQGGYQGEYLRDYQGGEQGGAYGGQSGNNADVTYSSPLAKRCFGIEGCSPWKPFEPKNAYQVESIVISNKNQVEIQTIDASPVTTFETFTLAVTQTIEATESVPTTIYDTATESVSEMIVNTVTEMSILTQVVPTYVMAPPQPAVSIVEEIPAPAPACFECQDVEPAPTEATPVDVTVDNMNSAKVDAIGTNSNDAIPNVGIPTDVISNDAIPTEAIPTEAIPTEAIPTEAIPADTIPADAIPNDTIPNNAVVNDAIPNDSTLTQVQAPGDISQTQSTETIPLPDSADQA